MFHKPEIAQFIEKAQRGILAEVVFGNPQSDCRSLGVCKVHIGPRAVCVPNELKTKPCGCPSAITFLRLSQDGDLYIHFLNYSLEPHLYNKYFPENSFVVEAPFFLPRVLSRTLGLGEGQFFLSPGRYSALNDGLYHTVKVQVGTKK